MSIAGIVRALVSAGATPEMILAAVEAAEATTVADIEKRRASDAERQRQRRERQRHVTSRDCHVTSCDTPQPPLTLPQTPTQNPPLSPQVEVDGDRLRAADAMVSRIAEAAIPEGHALNGDVMAASVCLGWQRSGFDVELDAIPGVTKALAGRYRITRWDKLTSWVANHHADRMAAEMARPPPEILPPQAATVTQLRPRNEPASHFDIGRAVASRPPPGFGG